MFLLLYIYIFFTGFGAKSTAQNTSLFGTSTNTTGRSNKMELKIIKKKYIYNNVILFLAFSGFGKTGTGTTTTGFGTGKSKV